MEGGGGGLGASTAPAAIRPGTLPATHTHAQNSEGRKPNLFVRERPTSRKYFFPIATFARLRLGAIQRGEDSNYADICQSSHTDSPSFPVNSARPHCSEVSSRPRDSLLTSPTFPHPRPSCTLCVYKEETATEHQATTNYGR